MSVTKTTVCPTCGHASNEYARKINAGMAAALIVLAGATTPTGHYVHLPSELRRRTWLPPSARGGGDPAKLVYWHLIEAMPHADRGDGSTRSGFWRITQVGLKFAHGEITLRRFALVTGGVVTGFSGPEVTIHHAIGDAFSYEEAIGRKGNA